MFPFGSDSIEAVAVLGQAGGLSAPGRRLLRLTAQSPDGALLALGPAPEWLLLERLPSPAALRALTVAGHRPGVYLPSDAPHPTNRLGLPTDRAAALERLRRLALLVGPEASYVLADGDAIGDALHYAELVAPHAARLLLLGGTAEQQGRIREAFERVRAGG